MSETNSAPIIIVGGGPVGMMLALHLDYLGVASIILNIEDAPRQYPKGNTHNTRTMEHFRRIGLSKQLRTKGLTPDYPMDVVYCTRWNAWELARIAMPSEGQKAQQVANAQPTDQIVEPLFRCNQVYVENTVFEFLKTRPNIDVRFGWQCADWTQDADGVSVDVENVANGTREVLRCDYLVGCDGGDSKIRKKLGIRFSGGTTEKQTYFGATMLTAHIRSASFTNEIPHPVAWQYWTVNASIRSNIIALNGSDEFLYQIQLGENEQPSKDLIAKSIVDCMGKDFEFEVIDISTWTPGMALVADRYQSGNVLLCGDAVHLFTPTGGFGLNTGVDDAVNMAWKLAALVQGWGGPDLLATYETERRPIGLRNTTMAKSLTRSVGKVPITDNMEDDTPEGASARDKVAKILSNFTEEYASIGIQLGARYDGTPAIVSDGTTPPDDDPIKYVPTACPGGRAPHLWFSDKSSLYDHLGVGFTLLSFGAADTMPLEQSAKARDVPLKILKVGVEGARALYGAELALVRPDGIICWRGDILPDDCASLLKQVTGF